MDKNSGDAVVVEGLAKDIGSTRVLRGVNLRVRRGEVHVLAGPNGAGKTTTLRVILGLARRSAGRVLTLGLDPEARGFDAVKSRIGYLPEDAKPYERLTGWENLYFYALAYTGGDRSRARLVASRGAEIAGLPREALARRASTYSKGMARRLLLARALMHEPELAVLDEPTSGLDVFSVLRVRRLIRGIAGRGAAVLVTTHNLLEAQVIADRVTFIADGRSLCTCTVAEALERFSASNLEEAFVRAVGDAEGHTLEGAPRAG
ncbi:MAG: ABC transporter ATP-binding protein [Desulfurococcales archaeon]|nr:ABC transporter ATP-binding protein [Desulfurococcales archaeon]